MEWAIAVLAFVVLGVAAAVAAGAFGEMTTQPVRDTYRQDLGRGRLVASDIARVRFGVSVRGYRMDQVDDALARLSHEIADRDAEIGRLNEKITGRERA
jgi:DivIVA domain-containing protein